jgi:hypothetical protein
MIEYNPVEAVRGNPKEEWYLRAWTHYKIRILPQADMPSLVKGVAAKPPPLGLH